MSRADIFVIHQMLSHKFPQFPSKTVQILLFTDVTNAAELRSQLLKGNAEFNYAFIAAQTVVSLEHLLAAVYRALNDQDQDAIKTKGIHSEIVFSLSPATNIMEALRRFGVSDDSKALFAVKIIDEDEHGSDYAQFLREHVKGQEVAVTDEEIGKLTDLKLVKKYYKVEPTTDQIIPTIALKGFN